MKDDEFQMPPPDPDTAARSREGRRLIDNAMLAFLVFAGGLVMLIPGGIDLLFQRSPLTAPATAISSLSPSVPMLTNESSQAVEPSVFAPALPVVPPQSYCKQGYRLLHQERRVAEAVRIFETCVREYPDFSDAHHGLAQALRNAGDSTRALLSHDRAIELDPERHDLYWERGVTYLQRNNPRGAIANFEACLERKLDFANAHLGLAMAWRAENDLAEALLHHDEALRLKPDSAWFLRERAQTYRAKGEAKQAEADLARARDLERAK